MLEKKSWDHWKEIESRKKAKHLTKTKLYWTHPLTSHREGEEWGEKEREGRGWAGRGREREMERTRMRDVAYSKRR